MNVICILILGTIDIINTATTDNKESIGMIINWVEYYSIEITYILKMCLMLNKYYKCELEEKI